MASSHCPAYRFLHNLPGTSGLTELFCSAQSNIAGWSNYPAFLRNWLKHFPPEQLLVLYTEQFDKNPQLSLDAVHDFLGVKEHQYPDEVIGATHFNSGNCGYGWLDECHSGGQKDSAVAASAQQKHQLQEAPSPGLRTLHTEHSIFEAHSSKSRQLDLFAAHGGLQEVGQVASRSQPPPEVLSFFDAAVSGVLELAAEFLIPMPPRSWLANGRRERLNLTDAEYLRVHSTQVLVYQSRAQSRESQLESASNTWQAGVSPSLVELVRRAAKT